MRKLHAPDCDACCTFGIDRPAGQRQQNRASRREIRVFRDDGRNRSSQAEHLVDVPATCHRSPSQASCAHSGAPSARQFAQESAWRHPLEPLASDRSYLVSREHPGRTETGFREHLVGLSKLTLDAPIHQTPESRIKSAAPLRVKSHANNRVRRNHAVDAELLVDHDNLAALHYMRTARTASATVRSPRQHRCRRPRRTQSRRPDRPCGRRDVALSIAA